MELIDPRTVDERSRELIKNNIHENYFVEAGAGSGKTTVLVDRMVKMIEEDLDISKISAITFTKAAANEFYERFQKKLIEKSVEESPFRDKYLNALQNIDLAFMGTIDSFCNMIMSEHPREGLIPSGAHVINDDEAEKLYEREFAAIMNGEYNDPVLEEKGTRFLHYDDRAKESFITVLKSLLNHRDCEIQIPAYHLENIDERFSNEITSIRKIAKIIRKNPAYLNASNDDKNKKVYKAFDRYKKTLDGIWENNISGVLDAFKKTFGDGDLRLRNCDEVRNSLGECVMYFAESGAKHQWLIPNEDEIKRIYNYIKEMKYAVTLDFVDSAKEKILNKLRNEGALTFNDYLVYLRDTLRKDAAADGKLIKHIYERHSYFMIDEFQDTDPIQAEIFFFLAAKEIKTNWRECIPHKGSLFIVGDPKQSIYRFKNADVASYLKVEEMFKQPVGEVLYLYKNFRSTYEVKDYFNNTFSALLTKSDEQAKYENIPIDESEKLGGFTGVYTYKVRRPGKDVEVSEHDQYKVTELILKLYNNPNYMIKEKVRNEDGSFSVRERALDWKDFMVITPNKTSIPRYTKLFRENGIPYYVEGNIDFKQSKAFETFVSLYGAVTDIEDNRYLYKVLKSGLFNIKQKELSEAVKNGYVLNLLNEYETLNIPEKLKKAMDILKGLYDLGKTTNPAALFAKLIESTDVFKNEGNENMEYVFFVLELIKSKLISKEIISHKDTMEFFEKLMEEKNDQERCPGLMKDGNQVHVANLHKVKGLEAPVVIMASAITKKRDAAFRMVRSDEGNNGYVLQVGKMLDGGINIKIIETDKYDEPHKEDEETSNGCEKLRLEYVAATRARDVLIIGNMCRTDGTPASDNPWFNMMSAESKNKLNDIMDILEKEDAKSYTKKAVDYEDIEASENIIETNKDELLKTSIELMNPSKTVGTEESDDAEEDERHKKQANESREESNIPAGKDTLATITGTMVHRLMELIILSKDRLNKHDLIETVITEELSEDFKEKELYFRELLNRIYDTMHNGGYVQKGKAAQDILPVVLNSKAYPEVPFTYKDDEGRIWNGIIDLLYISDDGKVHIIDWKTNKNDEGLDEYYHNQLEAYKASVKKSSGIDVDDAFIYHIDLHA